MEEVKIEDSGFGDVGIEGGGEVGVRRGRKKGSKNVIKKEKYYLYRKVRLKIEEYFEKDIEHTYNGLLLELGITESQLEDAVRAYKSGVGEIEKQRVGEALVWGLMKIEEELERSLRVHKSKNNSIGAMFILKSKFNWKDKSEESKGVTINLVINGLEDGGKR